MTNDTYDLFKKKRGFAGEGRCEAGGVAGAGVEMIADMMMADLIESIAFPLINDAADAIENGLSHGVGFEQGGINKRLGGTGFDENGLPIPRKKR